MAKRHDVHTDDQLLHYCRGINESIFDDVPIDWELQDVDGLYNERNVFKDLQFQFRHFY